MKRDFTKASGVLDAAADYLVRTGWVMGCCGTIGLVARDAREGLVTGSKRSWMIYYAHGRAQAVFRQLKPRKSRGPFWWRLTERNRGLRTRKLREAAALARSEGD